MLIINWWDGCANWPTFTLEENLDLLPREECEFTFKEGIWYHIQENGIVRFFAHSGQDRNEGGYGGAAFTFLHNGDPKTVVGPWSSRASYLNTVLPEDQQVVEIRLDNGKQYATHCGILLSEFKKRWEFPDVYLLRSLARDEDGEKGPYTASLAPNCILKPSNLRLDKAQKYEIVLGPEENANT